MIFGADCVADPVCVAQVNARFDVLLLYLATHWPDLVNGVFEFGIAIPLSKGVMMLRRDKTVKGFYWPTIAWTTAWGLYNIFYYAHLNQWASWTGGLIVVSVNATWLAHVYAYRGGNR